MPRRSAPKRPRKRLRLRTVYRRRRDGYIQRYKTRQPPSPLDIPPARAKSILKQSAADRKLLHRGRAAAARRRRTDPPVEVVTGDDGPVVPVKALEGLGRVKTFFLAAGRDEEVSPKFLGQKEGFDSGPNAFISRNDPFLSRTDWPGVLPLEDVILLLNRVLDVRRKGRLFDFRDVFGFWSFKYQVVREIEGRVFVEEDIQKSGRGRLAP